MGKRLREDDPELLLPCVRDAALAVMTELRARSFDPIFFDGLRSVAEALANARRGVGVVNSVHCYGAAWDGVCAAHHWSCRAAGCRFFENLVEVGESFGFTSGARFKKVDLPHLQAVPVSQQTNLRTLGMGPETAAARDAFCKVWLAKGRKSAPR